METLERILADHAFFRDFDKNYLQLMVSCASNVRFEAGTYLFHEGEAANRFFLVREGKVALEVPTPQHTSLTIQTLNEGDVLGWSWLIPPYRWRFDAKAVTPTRAFAMEGECLRAKCEADQALGYQFLKRFTPLIVQRLQATRGNLLEVYEAYCNVADGRL